MAQALGVRINALRKRGRRVVVLGDLNIAPAPIDSCEPGTLSLISCKQLKDASLAGKDV